MNNLKKRGLALVLALCMASTFALTACSQVEQTANDVSNAVAQMIEGNVTGTVGTEYATKWFTFTVDSMETAQSYDSFTAADGNTLLIAHITETNTSGDTQPFGTFDWFVDDGTLENPYFPINPLNDQMMPSSFDLADGETASYDVVIEYPADMAGPCLTYTEYDVNGTSYATFKIPIK